MTFFPSTCALVVFRAFSPMSCLSALLVRACFPLDIFQALSPEYASEHLSNGLFCPYSVFEHFVFTLLLVLSLLLSILLLLHSGLSVLTFFSSTYTLIVFCAFSPISCSRTLLVSAYLSLGIFQTLSLDLFFEHLYSCCVLGF